MKTLILLSTIFISLSVFSQKCPMPEISEWQTQTVGKESKSQIDALTDLVIAAEGDISQVRSLIDAKAKGQLKIGWSLSKESKKKKYKEVIWDKEVWQEIQMCRMAYCALYSEIKDGIYNTPELYASALRQLEEAKSHLLVAKKKAETSTVK